MTLAAGTVIGPYEIIALLGAGGMGEVYRARDTKLNRDIAIKVLPAAVASDPERLARFKREAQVLAALNHPNIAHIHGFEDSTGVRALVMELAEGPTLADRIARGSIPIDEALPISIQIAEALEAAHEQGIVHRDLKPANIKVNDDGTVKVLDFGIAKALDTTASNPNVTQSPTITTPAVMTGVGVILGTAAYMSPEQVRGKTIDKRPDIWAFGCVLYEMLSGVRPFRGETVSDTLAAVLRADVDWRAVPRGTPAAIRKLLRRCLERDLKLRLRDIGDARVEIVDVLSDPLSVHAPTEPITPRGMKPALWLIAAMVMLAAGIAVWGALNVGPPSSVLDGGFSRLTSQPGEELTPSFSPDGEFIVYASRTAGNWDVYLKRVRGEKPINLTHDSPVDDRQPAFSGDGRFIAFRSERDGGGIFVMGATGENVRKVTGKGFNPAWSPDGAEIAFGTDDFTDPLERTVVPSEIWKVAVAGGPEQLVAKGDAVQPSWSPDGNRVAYWGVHRGGQRDIWTVAAAAGEPVQVTLDAAVDWNPVWARDGRSLYFASDRGGSMNLWRVPIDERTGSPRGDPQPVTTPSIYSQHFSFARDGRSLAYVELINRINLQQVGFDADRARVSGDRVWITQGASPIKNPDLSPDGNSIVFDSLTGNQQEDLFIVDRAGTQLRQVTDDFFKDRGPRWSPDGRRIAFLSDRSGRYECWLVNPDGSGLKQLTFTTGPRYAQAPIWSPDGTRLACNTQFGAPLVINPDVDWKAQTPEIASPGGNPDSVFFAWSWSPDGRALVGRRDQGVVSFTFSSGRFQQLADFGTHPRWLRDSRRVLFEHEGALYLASLDGSPVTQILSVAPDAIQRFTISPDNRTLLLAVWTREADVWTASLR